jgi:hypothetical protein
MLFGEFGSRFGCCLWACVGVPQTQLNPDTDPDPESAPFFVQGVEKNPQEKSPQNTLMTVTK